MSHPPAVHKLVAMATACLALVIVLGCGRDQSPTRIPTYPVRGSLTVNGQPAPGAIIKFLSPQAEGRTPTAVVREDGSFQASFYDQEDGAPQGEYRLVAVWMATPPEGGMPQDRLNGRFLDPTRPIATITVSTGENRIEPIHLQTR